MKKTLTAGLAALALTTPVLVLASAPAEAKTLHYSSCDRLHHDFRYGVAKSARAAQKQVRDGYHRPSTTAHAKDVYRANHSNLDRDDDGTACES